MKTQISPTLHEILSIFTGMVEGEREVTTASDFQGIAISHPCKIISVNDDQVVLKASFEICMLGLLHQVIYLVDDLFPGTIAAKMDKLHLETGFITLRDFYYTGQFWKKRSQPRVTPDRPTQVIISHQKNVQRGWLANISENGLCVRLFEHSQSLLNPQSPIIVKFRIPPLLENFRMIGKVIYQTANTRNDIISLGIMTTPNLRQQGRLREYINNRHKDVFRLLEYQYHIFKEPQYTKDLYF